MRTRQVLATGLVVALVTALVPMDLAAQNAAISGTAKNEAKKPYTSYNTRARNTQNGAIAGTVALDANGDFSLTGLSPANYVVELLDGNGKVVCTEGPFNLTQSPAQSNVNIKCNKKVPTSLLLLGAAGAAGITAGVVGSGSSTPAPAPAVSQFSITPAVVASPSQ